MSIKEQDEQQEIRKTIIIDASPEAVFKAITDPEELTNWFPDQAVLEPKVGGKVKFSFYKDPKNKNRDMDYFPEGTIMEFIANKKITYTWIHPNVPDFPKTTVTWELEKIENNKTRVDLLHTGFKGEASKRKMLQDHDTGWTYFLNKLEEYCKGR